MYKNICRQITKVFCLVFLNNVDFDEDQVFRLYHTRPHKHLPMQVCMAKNFSAYKLKHTGAKMQGVVSSYRQHVIFLFDL
jgi:hypothetical protein